MDMKRLLFILSFLFLLGPLYAQNNTFREQYENFRREAFSEYSSFRNECNKKYAEFLLQSWEWFESLQEIPKPVEEEVPPVIYEEKPTPIKDSNSSSGNRKASTSTRRANKRNPGRITIIIFIQFL